MAREQLQGLSEPMYYLLLALRTPQHGYGIMQTVQQISGGRVKIGAGTLYALLSRFESEQIVYIVSSDGRKKVYALTQNGADLLQAEYDRLKSMLKDADMTGGTQI